MIDHILDRVNYEDLLGLLNNEQISLMAELVGIATQKQIPEKRLLINTLEALYGSEILNEKKIRHLILTTLDENTLNYLARKYASKVYSKPYDNALQLSLVPWKGGSDFVAEIADLLNIPFDDLPVLNQNDEPTTEEVYPFSKLNPLHNYQYELKKKILDYLNKDCKRFLVQMPTGSGKTRTVMESVIEFCNSTNFFKNSQSVIWIAHTEELCEQAIETLVYLWPHLSTYTLRLTRFWGSHVPDIFNLKGGFVFGTFQKLATLVKGESSIIDYFKNNPQIVIVDEAHKTLAKSYLSLINTLLKNEKTLLIGITATPGRGAASVEENIELADIFDKQLLSPSFTENPIIALRKMGVLSYLKRTIINTNVQMSLHGPQTEENGALEDISKGTLIRLSRNKVRNKLILELIEQQIQEGNPCLVFSCNTDHSKLLHAALYFKGIKSHYLDANTPKFKRKKIIDDFKTAKVDVLINYGILTTGFDAPRIKTLIITRPTSSVILYSQMIGRGLRGPQMGGSNSCNLFDLKDNFINFGGVERVYNFFEGYW